MPRKMRSHNAVKAAARQFQQANPGTPYPAAKRAVENKQPRLQFEFVPLEEREAGRLAAHQILGADVDAHLRMAQRTIALAIGVNRRDQDGIAPRRLPAGITTAFWLEDGGEFLDRLVELGLWASDPSCYRLMDAECLALARSMVEEEWLDYQRLERICVERGAHVVQMWSDRYPEDSTVCSDCNLCVCDVSECDLPHSPTEVLLFEHHLGKPAPRRPESQLFEVRVPYGSRIKIAGRISERWAANFELG